MCPCVTRTDTGKSTQQGRSLGSNYYKLWVASAISNLGDGVRLAALPLLRLTKRFAKTSDRRAADPLEPRLGGEVTLRWLNGETEE